jgi:hypothetical protein
MVALMQFLRNSVASTFRELGVDIPKEERQWNDMRYYKHCSEDRENAVSEFLQIEENKDTSTVRTVLKIHFKTFSKPFQCRFYADFMQIIFVFKKF